MIGMTLLDIHDVYSCISGCEYGDQSRYCTKDDCNDPRLASNCCATCSDDPLSKWNSIIALHSGGGVVVMVVAVVVLGVAWHQ